MKVLFVSSGNSKNFDVTPFIKAQGESIRKIAVTVDYFTIKERGIKGYVKYGLKLKNFLKDKNYDLIHVHYSLSGWPVVIGTFTKKIPIVLSLMGSDAYGEYIDEKKITFISRKNILLTLFIQPFVNKIISKSKNIEKYVFLKQKSTIVPNGIDLEKFIPISDRKMLRTELGFEDKRKYILFLGNKQSIRKNFLLVEDAVSRINDKTLRLFNPFPINHNEVHKYVNAADMIVLTSYAEGSPNIIKEAMACNCPIVSTNVGDVEWLFGHEPGHFLTSFDPEDVATKIKLAIKFAEEKGRTNGRQRIVELGLDSETVARRIVKVYEEAISDAK